MDLASAFSNFYPNRIQEMKGFYVNVHSQQKRIKKKRIHVSGFQINDWDPKTNVAKLFKMVAGLFRKESYTNKKKICLNNSWEQNFIIALKTDIICVCKNSDTNKIYL